MKTGPYLILSLALGACAPHAEDVPRNDVPLNDVPRPAAAEPDSVTEPETDPVTQPPAAATATDSVRGTVVVTGVGPSPYATLTSSEGPIMLAGALETELRQLGGAQVDVFGELTGAQRRSLTVQRYEVLAIDGERPVVGTVLADGRRIAAGDTLTVVGLADPLPAGAKIWIVGRRDGTQLSLQSWGVIRRQ
jgi:hypothetical protein